MTDQDYKRLAELLRMSDEVRFEDWAVAGKVIEAMRERGYECEFWMFNDSCTYPAMCQFHTERGDGPDGEGKTGPEAICKAALKALDRFEESVCADGSI